MPLTARPLVALCALSVAAALGACGDTVQDRPIPHNILEGLIAAPFPVYWLGGSFQGMAITEAAHDPGGAYTVQYGDCLAGGQGTCMPRLRVVTSPDNSFLPGGDAPRRATSVRGVAALVAQAGETIEIPTGGVVVGIYATDPHLADRAAQRIVPINSFAAPEAPLPARAPDTGFAEAPLPVQTPNPLRGLR